MKHQGQKSAMQTNKYSRLKHSGATKHQTSTRAGKNPQSTAKSTHQGQMSGPGSSRHQGDPKGVSSGHSKY